MPEEMIPGVSPGELTSFQKFGMLLYNCCGSRAGIYFVSTCSVTFANVSYPGFALAIFPLLFPGRGDSRSGEIAACQSIFTLHKLFSKAHKARLRAVIPSKTRLSFGRGA